MLTRPITPLQHLFWQFKNANPLIYLYKVGQGLLALYVSYLLEKIPGILKKAVDWLTLMGKEALFVYAFHLIIIYGSPFNKGLYKYYKESLDLTTIMLLGIAIIFINIIGAYLWSEIKKRWLIILRILFAIAALIFIIKPY
jgi:predicted MFS family arabinose efflux permease